MQKRNVISTDLRRIMMSSIYREAAALCRSGTPFVWAAIIKQDGSTPRSAGSKMIILKDSIISTIGGGGMEGQVIDLARSEVLANKRPQILCYHMSGDANATLGLACGGDCRACGDTRADALRDTRADA